MCTEYEALSHPRMSSLRKSKHFCTQKQPQRCISRQYLHEKQRNVGISTPLVSIKNDRPNNALKLNAFWTSKCLVEKKPATTNCFSICLHRVNVKQTSFSKKMSHSESKQSIYLCSKKKKRKKRKKERTKEKRAVRLKLSGLLADRTVLTEASDKLVFFFFFFGACAFLFVCVHLRWAYYMTDKRKSTPRWNFFLDLRKCIRIWDYESRHHISLRSHVQLLLDAVKSDQ